jgi:hypothetical protein
MMPVRQRLAPSESLLDDSLASQESRPYHRLPHREIAADATREFVIGVEVNELETIAESVSLASHCTKQHGVAWKHEDQLHDLAQRSFNCQHRGHPGFANVHATANQLAARPGINSDINLKFEPRTSAGIRDCPIGARCGWILCCHIPNSRGSTMQCDTKRRTNCIPFRTSYNVAFSFLIGMNLTRHHES